mmetsp:Transcript_67/g.149  ORF Transcript_67/g.149 Transcript_67/m.149 type:complete len:104 (-) Transcript_67:226-537(-)
MITHFTMIFLNLKLGKRLALMKSSRTPTINSTIRTVVMKFSKTSNLKYGHMREIIIIIKVALSILSTTYLSIKRHKASMDNTKAKHPPIDDQRQLRPSWMLIV